MESSAPDLVGGPTVKMSPNSSPSKLELSKVSSYIRVWKSERDCKEVRGELRSRLRARMLT